MTDLKTLPVSITYNPQAIMLAQQDAHEELTAARQQTITTAEDFQAWGEIARVVMRRKAEVDAMRDSVIKPLNEAKRAAEALFAPAYEVINALDAYIRNGLGMWSQLKAKEQREQMALAAKAANAGNTTALTTALNAVQSAAPVKLEGVSLKEEWTAEVVAPDSVPRDWCVPDEKLLKRYAKGLPVNVQPVPIAGVRFALVAKSTVRK